MSERAQMIEAPGAAELDGLLPHQAAALGLLWRVVWQDRGALVAWPVGSGKTWLGCALARLGARRAGLRAVVVAPARLLPMWRRVAAALGVEPEAFVSHRCASLGALPAPADAAQARATLWLVDEAHAFRNPATRRHAALARAVAAGRVCLLTATPFNTRLDDVAALLGLFGAALTPGPSRGAPCDGPPFAAARPSEPPCDSLRESRPPCGGTSGASERSFGTSSLTVAGVRVVRRVVVVEPCCSEGLAAWREAIDALCAAPWPVFSPDVAPGQARALVRDALLYRLLGHPVALLATLRRLRRYYGQCRDPHGGLLDRATFARVFGRDGPVQNLLPFAWPVRRRIQQRPSREAEGDQEALREAVLEAIGRAHAALRRAVLPWSHDPRLAALEGLLREHVGAATRRFALPDVAPVVCFTQSAEVAAHVAAQLGARGWAVGLVTGREARLGGQRLAAQTLLGSLAPDGDGGRALCQVLVCTDVLGQGHNLQRAQGLVHLDRPWNPVRMAQREGRLVRHGQASAQVVVARLAVRAHHPALAELEARLDAALAERRAGAAALAAGLTVATAPAPHRAGELDGQVASLLGVLLERMRALRRHPQARSWLERVTRLRRALTTHRLPTGTRLVLDELLAGELPSAPDEALEVVEAALGLVLR